MAMRVSDWILKNSVAHTDQSLHVNDRQILIQRSKHDFLNDALSAHDMVSWLGTS